MQRAGTLAILAILVCALAPSALAQGPNTTVSAVPRDVRAQMRGVTWQPGCPVGFKKLRLITTTHHTPGGGTAQGQLIVHADAAPAMKRILARLWKATYPIEKMVLIDAYGGDDWESIEDNNTSAFNCRKATGSSNWSNHAYGFAVDINPIQNPYVSNGKVFHDASWKYIDRSRKRSPMMILAGDPVQRAFAAEGWGWGGAWSGTKDYQHFSVNGR